MQTSLAESSLISKTNFSVFRRSLHILALIQHSTEENWNATTLADLLSQVPGEEVLDSKAISTCRKKLAEMGFHLSIGKGEKRLCLDRPLEDSDVLEIMNYYMNNVVQMMGVRDCFSSYVASAGTKSLWIIGRIYFAAIEQRTIIVDYRSEKSGLLKQYTLNPYYWVYRDNAVYLVSEEHERGILLLRLNRIEDFELTDHHFNANPPEPSELFANSLGAFLGEDIYNIVIEFPENLSNRVTEDFGRLELLDVPGAPEGFCRAGFSACDLLSVCTRVFAFGGGVKLIAPDEAKDEMRRLCGGVLAAHCE